MVGKRKRWGRQANKDKERERKIHRERKRESKIERMLKEKEWESCLRVDFDVERVSKATQEKWLKLRTCGERRRRRRRRQRRHQRWRAATQAPRSRRSTSTGVTSEGGRRSLRRNRIDFWERKHFFRLRQRKMIPVETMKCWEKPEQSSPIVS